MNKQLGEPFGIDDSLNSYEEEIDDINDISSVESSPLVNKINRNPPFEERQNNFGILTSANFSTDSIAEVEEDLLNIQGSPSTPNASSGSIINFSHSRRYSISGLSSPTSIMRPNSSSKPRPKSAFFGDDVFKNEESPYPNPNSSISLQSPVSRNNHRRNYVPPPIIAPPYSSRSGSPTRSTSPSRSNKHFRSKSPVRTPSSPTKQYQPFNFKSQEMSMNNNLSVKPAHRKGHKYKHSSVSMNFFQEPTPSNIDNEYLSTITDSFPIPTLSESIASITKDQKIKLGWSAVHLMLSLLVFLSGHKIQQQELSTLAHLIFYDSLGSIVIILVEIMSNFDVWNNASLVYPFGLGRLEVLIGFALGASLVMVGFDLLSHICEEFIIVLLNMGEDSDHGHGGSHHVHRSDSNVTNLLVYYVVLVSTIAITLITSNYILAAKKINKIIKETPSHNRNVSNMGLLDDLELPSTSSKTFEKLEDFASIITKNPTYILTLSYAVFLVLSPIMSGFISKQFEIDLNEMASIIISLLFCLTGWKLVKALGEILLLSYPSTNIVYNKLKASILNEISGLEMFKKSHKVDRLFITKFNYDTFVVGIKVSMPGASVDEEAIFRFEVSRLINRKLQRRQRGNFKLELTADIDRT
ncbi:hypothetical protein CANTEDRAFT_115480 [Yamadazyma tenuis ATCC 10573]|nr:uncharacterized protein CANTEDRAFT_115480 [Yamadazyma tenuis ATCC 10573]EGV62018.1 hypothetical protein CANTEDRAFT_115480 [Yamadazyma tenuis ATCC 10573]